MTPSDTISRYDFLPSDTVTFPARHAHTDSNPQTVFGNMAEQTEPFSAHPECGQYFPPGFGLYMLAVLVAYCITAILYRPGRSGRTRVKSEIPADSLKPLNSVLGIPAAITGFLAIGTAAVKAAALYGGASWAAGLPGWAVATAPLFLGFSAFAIAAFQIAALRAIGTICYCRDFTYKLMLIKAATFRTTVIFATPLLLISGMASGATGNILWYCYLSCIALGTLIFLVRSLRLYAEEKISILLWFLYLCTLEIIPVWAMVKTVRGII